MPLPRGRKRDESKLILPQQDRRGFLRTAALAGAGLILPRALDSAQAAAKTEAQKRAAIKSAATKPVSKPVSGPAAAKPAAKPVAKPAAVKPTTPIARPVEKVERLNVAIIGAGSQGRNLMLNALRIPGINFVAVADIWSYSRDYGVNLIKSNNRTKKINEVPRGYVDYREMLEKEKNLDAVIVATPDWMHAPNTIDSLRAGKHVYCEKEMSNTLEGARRWFWRSAKRASCSKSGTSGAATRATGRPTA
jgi:hypothetical protein